MNMHLSIQRVPVTERIRKTLDKKPVQTAQGSSQSTYSDCSLPGTATNWAATNTQAPDFVSSEIEAKVVQFGAFRTFEARAESARILAMQSPHDLQIMPFELAAQIWLDHHKEEISERTFKDYEFYIRSLSKKFKGMLLSQIHIGHILEYRKDRQKSAGAWCINHEITTLKQIMEMAGLWDLVGKHYKPMRIQASSKPRVLSPEDEEKFFRVVAENPDWSVAYWACSLTNNTSAFGAELRFLQLKHLFLDQTPPMIHIPDLRAKNEFRARAIPLNSVALKQVKRLLARANRIGSLKPDHYLFPFRIKKGEYDINRPASAFFIRSAFRSMRAVLGPEYSWLTPRCFRSQCFTKLFESGAPDETIISIGGHAAIKMSRYYSRIRIHAKADALEKIAPASVGKRKDVETA